MKYTWAGLLFCTMMYNTQSSAEDMQRSIMNAVYKQTGTEAYIDTVVKNLDKEYVPDSIRSRGAVVLILLQGSITHQIGWKWRF